MYTVPRNADTTYIFGLIREQEQVLGEIGGLRGDFLGLGRPHRRVLRPFNTLFRDVAGNCWDSSQYVQKGIKFFETS